MKQKELYKFLFYIVFLGGFYVPFFAYAEGDTTAVAPLATKINNEQSVTPEYVIVQPSDQTTFSSETVASVSNLSVKEGSHFHAGDVLLELDCRVQKAELKKALAQQAETTIAKKSADKLASLNSISEYEMVKANSEAMKANAEVNKLNAIVDKCIVKAPFNGAVAQLMVHVHETVRPGDPLLKIVNTDNLDLQLQVPSTWLQWLHVGSEFIVHINDINKEILAKVTKINPEIEPISQTIRITGGLVEPDTSLLPGMTGQATFNENPNRQDIKRKK